MSQIDFRKLSEADWELLQQRADRFAEQLKKGPVDDWEPFVEGLVLPLRQAVLREMVKIDLDHRWQRGEKPLLEEYLSRHAEIGDLDTLPVDLICEEYRVRKKRGGSPQIDDYFGRFPEQYPAFKEEMEKEQGHGQQTVDFNASAVVNTIVTPTQTAAPSREQSRPTLSQGADNYEKTDLLGRGNFGEVWKAKAPGGIEVAIKVVTQPIERDAAQRELHSLELVKNLRHPCLLSTLAIWITNDRLHIVMELADGSLRDRFKQARKQNQPGIPLGELLMYFADAAEGLDFLHTRKVFHRDVKPDNILLLHGHGKVADFGLARLQEKQMATVSFAGTPIYMAPESWGGKGGPRSDQYSLAFTYAELRQGRRPIEGGDFTEVMMRTVEGQVDLDGLPAEEAKIVRRALAKNPDDRFANCSEFVATLARATHNPVRQRNPIEADLRKLPGDGTDSATVEEAYSEAVPVRTGKKSRKLITVGALLGLLAGGAIAVWQPWRGGGSPNTVSSVPAGPNNDKAVASNDKGGVEVVVPKKDVVETPKEALFVPDRFKPVAGSATVEVGGLRVPQRIEFPLRDGGKAVYILLSPTAGKPFYLMENKVWNSFFAEFARSGLLGGNTAWRNDLPARQPVTRISAAEAVAFAKWLGGKLPTAAQWDFAAGVPGRAGQDCPSLDSAAAAIGRSEPRSLDDPVHDESASGIRDLGGNGREWTRTLLNPDGSTREMMPDGTVAPKDLVVLRGRNFTLTKPLSYADLKYEAKVPQTQFYSKASPYTTFRVVIELPD